MPIINAAGRKRSRSNSRIFQYKSAPKTPRLAVAVLDGTDVRSFVELPSPHNATAGNLKDRLKRTSSHLKTLFGFSSRGSEDIISPQTSLHVKYDGSGASFHSLNPSTCTMIVRHPRITLLQAPPVTQDIDPMDIELSRDINGNLSSRDSNPQISSISNHDHPGSLHRSHSIQGLKHRITNKLRDNFGNHTVRRRSSLRSRPSMDSVIQTTKRPLNLPKSFVSTATSGSYIVLNGGLATPPTSDSLPVSPFSAATSPTSGSFDMKRAAAIFNAEIERHRLSPISELVLSPQPTITTIEAAANVKIFLETHYNQLLSGADARTMRSKAFETNLAMSDLPPSSHEMARQKWQQSQTNHLRRQRLMMAKSAKPGSSLHISAAGYEAVRILGKGSFGVVRLVREKNFSQVTEVDQTTNEGISLKSAKHEIARMASAARYSLRSTSLKRQNDAGPNKQVFAMKVIKKSAMIRNSQEGHLRAERDFLVTAEGSRWIVPLLAAFEDARYLYLVMEFCIGGDFLGLLIRKSVLSEEVTRWYIAEMILCIEEAHRMKWIHRDVKPDNFLLGADGHLRISDFGLAFDGDWSHAQSYYHQHRHSLVEKLGLEIKGDEEDQQDADVGTAAGRIGGLFSGKIGKSSSKKFKYVNEIPDTGETILDWRNRKYRRDFAQSVVGTSQYMAPEVIRGDYYDGRCDWWSIGIIMYECLYGYTPFACESRQDTKLRILKHRKTLNFPSCPLERPPVSFQGLDLMMALIVEREERLSSQVYRYNNYLQRGAASNPGLIGDKATQYCDPQGHFVFPNDAVDLKRHRFFRNIPWEELHTRRPPFVPRVKHSEDTKYFDEDGTVSDMSESSEDGEMAGKLPCDVLHPATDNDHSDIKVTKNVPGSSVSHHQHEDQKIIPSIGLKGVNLDGQPTMACEESDVGKTPNPLLSPKQASAKKQDIGNESPSNEGSTTTLVGCPTTAAAEDLEASRAASEQPKKKRKEKKRPRDKILRDAKCAKVAMDMRKKGAFLGYEYIRPEVSPVDVITEVLQESSNQSTKVASRVASKEVKDIS